MMTKLTKDILLKKGLPKSSHLKDLKTLNLSKMQLETKDLDPHLFSQLLNLEELDLSKNCLSDLPEKLSLPKLKVLNFSDNQVEDVTILQGFPNLEEVIYEDNLYLTVSDNYKVCCLLPKLRRLNNKDITSQANHIRFVNHRELTNRVESYWEKNYKGKLPDEPSPSMIKSVSKEFLKSVGNDVKYGPNSLKDFTKWKVQIIAENLISSSLGGEKKRDQQASASKDAAEAPVTPSKKKHNSEPDCEVETPAKRLRSSDVLSAALSPRRSSILQESPLRSTPVKNNPRITPIKNNPRITPVKNNPSIAPVKNNPRITPVKNNPSIAPVKNNPRITPVKNNLSIAPVKNNPRITPVKNNPSIAPVKNNPRITPVKNNPSIAPVKNNPRITPVKNKPSITPVKESGLAMPKDVGVRITPLKKERADDREVTRGKQKREMAKKRSFDLEPIHFLQTHSKNNDSDDFRTQLWSCAFEPNLHSFSSKIIATCGGESICVIDCETGKVLKKYKMPGEEFFTLAWTTLTMICNEGQKRKINVLAAAGKCGVVRLMHPKVSLCYGEIKAHKKAISIMCFSPAQDTFLFTGSYDKRIILWDIGVPDYEYNFRASQLLTLDTTSPPLRLCPVPASLDQYLLAACEDGCFVWDITLKKQQGRRSYEAEFNFPIYNKDSKDADFHIVDALAFLNDDLIASKSAMQGSIYIWSWKKSFQKPRSKSSRKLDAAILAELKWSETDLPYLTLSTSAEGHCVFCGDEAGKVWIYDLESCKAELQKGVPCSALKEPTKVINWPFPVSRKDEVSESVINTVLVDPAMEYLVSLTDKNIIAIWKIL